MSTSITTLRLELRPAPALSALLALHAAAHSPHFAFSARLAGAAAAECARLEDRLAVLALCLEWFEDHDLAAVARPRAPGKKPEKHRRRRAPAYQFPVTVELEPAAVVAALARTEGAGH